MGKTNPIARWILAKSRMRPRKIFCPCCKSWASLIKKGSQGQTARTAQRDFFQQRGIRQAPRRKALRDVIFSKAEIIWPPSAAQLMLSRHPIMSTKRMPRGALCAWAPLLFPLALKKIPLCPIDKKNVTGGNFLVVIDGKNKLLIPPFSCVYGYMLSD